MGTSQFNLIVKVTIKSFTLQGAKMDNRPKTSTVRKQSVARSAARFRITTLEKPTRTGLSNSLIKLNCAY